MNKQCHARTRDGDQCKKPAMNGLTVCLSHGGATKRSKAKAHRLMDQTALPAVIVLRDIMLDENTDAALKVKTALGLLDRIPGFGRNSKVETSNPALEGVFQAIFKQVPAPPEVENQESDMPGTSIFIDKRLGEEELAALEASPYPQPTYEETVEAEVVEEFEAADHSNVLSFDTPIVRGSANPPHRR